MNRYSNLKDNTMRQPSAGPGLSPTRLCWTCSKPKPDAGGRLDKRTRLWSCAACAGVKR